MKLLEIKNNLVKISYTETETPILGRFIVLAANDKSYVAQFVNLKSDTLNNYAIAKLLFTFTPDGVVDNYDGSIPGINSELSFLPAKELLELLPIETAIKIGTLAQQEDMLSLDISVFESNFTVFVDKDLSQTVFISNCVRQLFQMKEKTVIIDTNNLFEDYPKLVFTKDFKLPLNSRMIDYIFEYELAEVDAATKAVIQDIFYAVQQYIKTLDYEFLPIDNFVDVVADQYKDIHMPELALLKNKLLKYRDANVFANTKEEIFTLKEKLQEKNCTIIDLKDIHESLQKEVLSFIHKTLEDFDKYIYFFVPLTDGNSDKPLLKQFINNNHIFTIFIAGCSYKYSQELKQYAQNMIVFAPQTQNHNFTAFNTFINKLNIDECIVYGKLTQGIPFIIDMSDLDLDLTKDDVLGEKYQFVPTAENLQMVKIDDNGDKTPVYFNTGINEEEQTEKIFAGQTADEQSCELPTSSIPEISQPPIELVEEELSTAEPKPTMLKPDALMEDAPLTLQSDDIQPVQNIIYESSEELPAAEETEIILQEPEINEEIIQPLQETDLTQDFSQSVLTEADLDFIEDTQISAGDFIEDEEIINEPVIEEPYEQSPYIQEQPPVVPVYPVQEQLPDVESAADFQQGDSVTHPRYGRGVIEKIIKYGNKTLCSISFENVGRRLLDPTISDLTKLE